MQEFIGDYIDRHQSAVRALAQCADDIERMASICVSAMRDGNKILICGNGGSAADAQHMAAELVGRFVSDRRALPAIALTTDTSALTAIANDYGYDDVFSRQVAGLAQRGGCPVGHFYLRQQWQHSGSLRRWAYRRLSRLGFNGS